MSTVNASTPFFVLKAWFTLLAIGLLLIPAQGQNRAKIEKELRKVIKLEPDLNLDDIPAYVVGIIHGDSTYVFGYGDTGIPGQRIPNEQTLFEIGGLTKIFTAALAEILAERNIICLDSSFNYYLPESYRNPHLKHTRLVDLLSHSSGLPKMPSEFGAYQKDGKNPYAYYSKKQLLQFYRDFVPSDTEGEYTYSHVNYALLEVALELRTQQSFEELLREYLLQPLQLGHTFIQAPTDSLVLAQGHSVGGQKSQAWSFASFAASEGGKSCAADLLQFVRYNLSASASPISPTLIKTHQKQTITDYNKRVFSAKGWHLIERRGYFDTLIHTGNTGGFRSFLAFIPESQTAVVILSNSEIATGGLGFLTLRLINNNFKRKKNKKH